MGEALENLMKDVIEEREAAAARKAAQEAAQKAARMSRLEAIASMVKNLRLTEEEAMDALDIPASERSIYAVWLTKYPSSE